jgi:UTP-glucose-1-phosphate uridylyltransferase
MIETAVVPAAGYGSRMRPLTMVIPKEMLPLGQMPMVEYTIRELVSSGIKRICIVIRKGKEVIKEYLNNRKTFNKRVELHFAYQKAPLGLGDAIKTAKNFIEGDPRSKQLLEACKNARGIWSSMVEIPQEEIRFFRGPRPLKYRRNNENLCVIEDISSGGNSPIRGFGRTLFCLRPLNI